MQKKLIALAIAAISAAPAFAQSNVTIYGRADLGYLSRSGDNGGVASTDRRNEFASGIGAGSRIGFKGSEDLGGGLKAIWQMEFGTNIDDGLNTGATWGNRNSWLGVTGNFGTVVGGKLDGIRYGIFNKYDAFGGGFSGNFTQMTAHVDRASNAVAYISPKFMGGFDLTLAYATHIGANNALTVMPSIAGSQALTGMAINEGSAAICGNSAAAASAACPQGAVNGNDGDARLTSIRLAYGNGPIAVDLDWERVSFKSGAAAQVAVATAVNYAALIDDVTVWTVAGSYDFGMVKVAALYDNQTVEGRGALGKLNDIDSWFLSATIPFGNFVGKVTYGETEDDQVNSSEADKWGVGFQYNLSKRTNLYANYGSIDNSRNSAIRLSPAANGYNNGGQGAAGAYGVKGFDIGMAHSF